MPLSTEKLRILTFPQRIAGRALDLHVLLLPTQRLLNVLDPFPSVLNPGNDGGAAEVHQGESRLSPWTPSAGWEVIRSRTRRT